MPMDHIDRAPKGRPCRRAGSLPHARILRFVRHGFVLPLTLAAPCLAQAGAVPASDLDFAQPTHGAFASGMFG